MLELVKPRLICNGCGHYISYGNTFVVGIRVTQRFYFHDEECLKKFVLGLNSWKFVSSEDEDYDYYGWSYI